MNYEELKAGLKEYGGMTSTDTTQREDFVDARSEQTKADDEETKAALDRLIAEGLVKKIKGFDDNILEPGDDGIRVLDMELLMVAIEMAGQRYEQYAWVGDEEAPADAE